MSWQEMQTAPHDGTTIIVRYPLQGNVKRIAHYNTLHKFWESNGEPFWPVQQHCQWASIPPDVATPSPANGADPDDMEASYDHSTHDKRIEVLKGLRDGAVGEMPELPTFTWANENGALFDSAAMKAYARVAVLAEREAIAADYEKQAQDYINDHADYEPETGAIVWEFGDAGRDYHSMLLELAEFVRARI